MPMNNNTDMLRFIGMIRKSNNPQQFMIQMLENQAGNNPVMNNLLELAKKGDSKGIEQVARNLSKERGIDFDKEFSAFKEMMGF